MLRYTIRRLLELIPVLLIASIAIWSLIYAVPGNPVSAIAGFDATPEQIAATEARLGLDRPLYEQYYTWLVNVLRFDLGVSVVNGVPINEQILDRLPATIQLTLATVLLSIFVGVPLGLIAAFASAKSFTGRAVSTFQALSLALPTFWVGMLLILVFSISLRWIPSIANYVPFFEDPWKASVNAFLPALSMALYFSSVLSRFVAASVSETMSMDFVWFARSKGIPEKRVMIRHMLRNAAIPVVTVIGLQLGALLGGSIVVEVVFSYPGIGRMLFSAVSTRDYPTIQATVLLAVVGFLFVNFVVDLLYAVIDPRVRL